MNNKDGFWGGLLGSILGTFTTNLITNTINNNIEDYYFSFDETFSYVHSKSYNLPEREWDIVKPRKYIKHFNIFEEMPYHYLASLDSYKDSDAIDSFECSIFEDFISCCQSIWLYYGHKGIISLKNTEESYIIYTILEGNTLHIKFTEFDYEESKNIDNEFTKIKVLEKVWCQTVPEGKRLVKEMKEFYSKNKKLKVIVEDRCDTPIKLQSRKENIKKENLKRNNLGLPIIKDFKFDYIREVIEHKDFFDSYDLSFTLLFYVHLLKESQLFNEAANVLEILLKLTDCNQRTFKELAKLYIELKQDEKLLKLLELGEDEDFFKISQYEIKSIAYSAYNHGLNKSAKFFYEKLIDEGVNIGEAVNFLFDIYVRLREKEKLISELSKFTEDRCTFPLLEKRMKDYLSGRDPEDLLTRINEFEANNSLDSLLIYYNRYTNALYATHRTYIKPVYETQRKKIGILMKLERYDHCWVVLCRVRRNILCHLMDKDEVSQLSEVENKMAELLLEKREYVDALFHKTMAFVYGKIIDPQLKIDFEGHIKEDQKSEKFKKEITNILGKIGCSDFTDNRSLSNLHNTIKKQFAESGLEIKVKEPRKLYPSEFPAAQGIKEIGF